MPPSRAFRIGLIGCGGIVQKTHLPCLLRLKDAAGIVAMADPIALCRTTLTVCNEPANLFVGGFIGSPPMNPFHGTIERAGDSVEFVEAQPSRAGIRIGPRPRLAARAERRLQSPAILGIRAENIHDLRVDPDCTPVASRPVKVEVTEPMGAEIYLHLNSGASPARRSLCDRPAACHRLRLGKGASFRPRHRRCLALPPAPPRVFPDL